jgi:glutamine phosphoribosylpyrophosphate amidotransferase
MCGISGSSSFDKAFDLYIKNLKRGYFSSGFLAFDNQGNVLIKKQKERFDKSVLVKEIVDMLIEPTYYLFHSRAPTNSKEPYSDITCHPFDFDNYYVAHNGIITNFKSFPESVEFIVDSSIIPYHLTKNKGDIKKTFEAYEGLLTCWIYDYEDFNLKVVKAGSSLHKDENSFSSVPFEGSKFVDSDGLVFELINGELKPRLDLIFKYNNPYDL